MKKIIISFAIPFVLLGLMMFQGGCVKEDFDTVPKIKDTSDLVASATIAELKSIANLTNVLKVKDLITPTLLQTIKNRNTANGVQDIESIVIEGYVTTSDSTGNIYESFTIQDASGGIDIKVNSSDIYTIYRLKPGQKVMIKAKDLYLGYYRGTYQLGFSVVELGLNKIVGIPSTMVNSYVERTGWRKQLTPEPVTILGINSDHYQKLIRIDNVQFKVPFNKFSDLGENSNRTLIDCDGNIIFLRTSGFSKFADSIVPAGKGSIVGILNKYVNSDGSYTNQLVIRDLKDISFNEPRCTSNAPTQTKTISELKAMCTSSYLNITGNIVISGVVSGNDESGNIYKQLILQDASGGISLSVNITGLYPEFPIGTKVTVNCDGLCIGKYGNQVQLGMPVYSNFVQRLDPNTFFSKVFVTDQNVSIEPILTTIKGLSDNMINKVIKIENIQFLSTDLGKTWSDPFLTSNRYVEDLFGNKVLIRTSNYANFANTIIPPFSGTLTAVLSKFNSDYQLYIRDLKEVVMNRPRFNFILSQDFNSTSLGSPITIGGWKNFPISGTRTWLGMSSSISGTTHYYAEMNPSNSGEANNVAWLISPQVNLSGNTGKTLFFQTAFNNWAGNSTLEVFISTNFNGTDVAAATWTPISGARIVQQADLATNWVNSGNIDLSQYQGNIYVGFKCSATGGGSATIFRIDNVKIY